MTDGVLRTIKDWTGSEYHGCPWRAFSEPLVREVHQAFPFFSNGTLGMFVPDPSHRLMVGLRHFSQTREAIQVKQIELDRERAKVSRG